MKKNTLHSTFVLSFITFLFISCGDSTNQEKDKPAQLPAFPVTQLQKKTVTVHKDYPTVLEGIVNSDVRAKVSGYIQKVFVDEGEKVRKGQVLFKLETKSLTQDAGAAKAQISVAQVEVDKLIPLVEKGIISPVQLETAKANLQQAQAGYNSIFANVDYATIRSSVDGFVGSINFREGDLISPTDQIPLTVVSDISKVYAFFSLNETEYLDFLQKTEGSNLKEKLANFPEVDLILANGSTYSEKGKIETSSGQINRNTGAVRLRAIFDNPNQLVTNGNSGEIQVPTVYKDATVIPQEATFEQQTDILVFKLAEGDTVRTAIVKPKAIIDNLYVIDSGVSTNETIVVSGIGKLKNGMKISPQPKPFDEAVEAIPTMFKN